MFADLLSDEFAVPHIDETHLTEFVLSDELRAELQQMFEAEEHKYVSIGKASSVVQADAQFVFFSNAWFYLAALCRPYAGAVYQYFHFLDTTIRSNPSLMRLVKRRDFSAPDLRDGHDRICHVQKILSTARTKMQLCAVRRIRSVRRCWRSWMSPTLLQDIWEISSITWSSVPTCMTGWRES